MQCKKAVAQPAAAAAAAPPQPDDFFVYHVVHRNNLEHFAIKSQA